MSLRVRLLWFLGLPLAIVAILVAAGLAWWRWDGARQPKIGSDLPTMDRAIAATITATAGTAPLAISGVFRGAVCDLGLLRHGGRFTRSVDLYTEPGGETTLIDRIAAGLPATYQPHRGPAVADAAAPLTATVGGVELSVRQISPGWVIARARTGCTTGTAPVDPATDLTTAPGGADVTALLTDLGTTAAEVEQHRLACPGGQATVAVVTAPTDAAGLAQRLSTRVPAQARVVSTPSNRVVYRDGDTSVVIAASDDNSAVTIQHTSPC
jgi:hypothetical protein